MLQLGFILVLSDVVFSLHTRINILKKIKENNEENI